MFISRNQKSMGKIVLDDDEILVGEDTYGQYHKLVFGVTLNKGFVKEKKNEWSKSRKFEVNRQFNIFNI